MTETRKFDVYGVGSALVDIQVRVSETELAQTGLTKGGMALTDENGQAGILKNLASRDAEKNAGGSAANSLVAIAQLGGRAAFACSVGDDPHGRHYVDDISAQGVRVTSHPKPATTGTCLVLLTPDAERTMNTNLAVSEHIRPNDIDDDTLAASEWVYLEGYLLTSADGQATVDSIVKRAKAAGTKIALSLSDAFVVETQRERVSQLVHNAVELVFANRREAEAYTGESDPVKSLELLVTQCPMAVVTDGPHGSHLHLDGTTVHVPAHKAEAVDLTGAGDCYAAGVLFGLTNGLNARQSGWLGGGIAAQCVAQMGARLPVNGAGGLAHWVTEARRQ